MKRWRNNLSIVVGAFVLILTPHWVWAEDPVSLFFPYGDKSFKRGIEGIHGMVDEEHTNGNVHFERQMTSSAKMVNSANGNSGMVGINQASGDLNNQGNQRVIMLSNDKNAMNRLQLGKISKMESNVITSNGGARQDLIEDSFQNNMGIIGINQSSGDMNSQHNNLVIYMGDAISLNDIELGEIQITNHNHAEENSSRSDIITGSFSQTCGLVQVTQSAGDLNILGNNMAISIREVQLQ